MSKVVTGVFLPLLDCDNWRLFSLTNLKLISDLASCVPAAVCGTRGSPCPADRGSHEPPGEPAAHGGDYV